MAWQYIKRRLFSHDMHSEKNLTALVFVGTKGKVQLTFPSHYVKIAVVAVILLAVWGAISLSTAFYLRQNNLAVKERIQQIREHILQYEVDHENLFEKVYEVKEGPEIARDNEADVTF